MSAAVTVVLPAVVPTPVRLREPTFNAPPDIAAEATCESLKVVPFVMLATVVPAGMFGPVIGAPTRRPVVLVIVTSSLAGVTAVKRLMVPATETLVESAVAPALILKCVASVIEATVVLPGTPVPETADPTTTPTVLFTVTSTLPLLTVPFAAPPMVTPPEATSDALVTLKEVPFVMLATRVLVGTVVEVIPRTSQSAIRPVVVSAPDRLRSTTANVLSPPMLKVLNVPNGVPDVAVVETTPPVLLLRPTPGTKDCACPPMMSEVF